MAAAIIATSPANVGLRPIGIGLAGATLVPVDGSGHVQQARARAEILVDDLRHELEAIIATQESDPPDDEHDVEGSSIAFERARVKALLILAESRLAALDALEDHASTGSTGTCQRCDEPIGEERLEAVLGTHLCVRCAASPASWLQPVRRAVPRQNGERQNGERMRP